MIKNLKNRKKKKGFTLIELIIVIAIIAILAAIALPKFGEIRKNANAKADIATAKNIHSAVTASLEENGDLPTNPIETAIGSIPNSKLNGLAFGVKLDDDKNVIVYVGTYSIGTQVYPEPQDTSKNIWYGGTITSTPTPTPTPEGDGTGDN